MGFVFVAFLYNETAHGGTMTYLNVSKYLTHTYRPTHIFITSCYFTQESDMSVRMEGVAQ